tara:strand:+ start:311 stop:475 length:165 start_codon:yes stop_codon:yes gene_type:complete
MVILLNFKRMPRISAYLGISIHPGLNVSQLGKAGLLSAKGGKTEKKTYNSLSFS